MIRITFLLWLSGLITLAQTPVLSLVSEKNSPPPSEVTLLHNVLIGVHGRPLHAELAFPTHPPKLPMPAVLWIHGGGWGGGSYLGNNPALFLTAHGYLVASIEYRLSGEAHWPAQIEDCKLAVRWLRTNAAKYRVDPNHIGCFGHSAGGHLVTCLGTMDNTFEGTDFPGVSSQVQGVVDASGPVNFTGGNYSDNVTRPKDADILDHLFGFTYAARPEDWKKGSPIFYVKAGDPPFLIIQGEKDTGVTLAQAQQLQRALVSAGVSVQLVMVKGGNHMMLAAKGQPPAQPDLGGLRAVILAFFDHNLKK